jgi:DNA-binding Xre family transcriptional regulator
MNEEEIKSLYTIIGQLMIQQQAHQKLILELMNDRNETREQIGERTLENLRYNVKRLRIAKDLSQEALAELAGLEYKHYQRIEAGHWKGIQLRTIEALAEALGVLPCILICPPGDKLALKNLKAGRKRISK